LDALIAATRPILNRHGLSITQWPCVTAKGDDGLAPVLVTRLSHVGGEDREYGTPLYVEPKNMQGLGAAITYARRYAWAAALGIASEEDTDAVTLDQSGEEIPF
jgi:hypothetical protein